MGWLIAALGTGLAIGGTAAIYFGAPYIQVEWGYSEVIAGTTALSAGILAVGLAAILFALGDLKRLAVAGIGSASPPPSGAGSSPPPGRSHRDGEAESATALPVRHDGAPPHPIRDIAAPSVAASDTVDPSFRDGEPALFRPTYEPSPAVEQAPTVVGRYEANGASYVLFSDGTIEVETETGTRRYASMQELRDDIERQEAP